MILRHLSLLISVIQLSPSSGQNRPSESLKPDTASGISGQSSWSTSPGESDQAWGYNNDAVATKANKSSNRRGSGSRYSSSPLISSVRDFFSFGFGSRKSCAPSTPCRWQKRGKYNKDKNKNIAPPTPRPSIVKVPSRRPKIDPKVIQKGLEYIDRIDDKEKREYILKRLEGLQSGQNNLDRKIDTNERRRQYDERRRDKWTFLKIFW